jgi:hypothetical protein
LCASVRRDVDVTGHGSQVDRERREKSAIVESLGIFKFAKSAKSFLCHWVSAKRGRGERGKGN